MKGRLFVERTSKGKASSVSQNSNKKSVSLEDNEGEPKQLVVSTRGVRADYIGREGYGEHRSSE